MGAPVINALSKALEDIRTNDDLLRASGQLQNSGTLGAFQEAYRQAQNARALGGTKQILEQHPEYLGALGDMQRAYEQLQNSASFKEMLRAQAQLQNSGTLNELQKAYEQAQNSFALSAMQPSSHQELNAFGFGGRQRAVTSEQKVTPVTQTPVRVQKQKPPLVAGNDAGPQAITDTASIGQVARKVRKNLKLTQGKLSILAGVGRRFVSELENGKATLEVGRVLKVLSALGIDLLARQR